MRLFCDLDGVLANFDKRVIEITGSKPNELKPKDMWKALANSKDFYYSLDFMPDAKILWNNIKGYDPIILTGLPLGNWAKGQKVRWVGDNLGWDVPIITCFAKDKPSYADEGDILIDDRLKAKAGWEEVGGIFIHHTSAENSIEELNSILEK